MATEPQGMQKTAPGALKRPDFMPESNAGREEVGIKDILLPRLGLCQNNSRARDKNNAKKYIKGLEEGQFYNSLTGEIYGAEVQVVPLFFFHSRIMFRDMKEGGGIICQAPDGKHCQMNNGGPCLHSTFGPKGEPPECNEFFNYPCLIYAGAGDKTKEWIVVSLKTTGLAAGREWNSMQRLRGTAAYGGVYTLRSVATSKDGQSYYTWSVENFELNPFVDPELYRFAESQYKSIYEGMKSGAIKVDTTDDDAFAGRDTEV